MIKDVMAQWSEEDYESEVEEEDESNISIEDQRRLSYVSTSRVSLGSVVEEENMR